MPALAIQMTVLNMSKFVSTPCPKKRFFVDKGDNTSDQAADDMQGASTQKTASPYFNQPVQYLVYEYSYKSTHYDYLCTAKRFFCGYENQHWLPWHPHGQSRATYLFTKFAAYKQDVGPSARNKMSGPSLPKRLFNGYWWCSRWPQQ